MQPVQLIKRLEQSFSDIGDEASLALIMEVSSERNVILTDAFLPGLSQGAVTSKQLTGTLLGALHAVPEFIADNEDELITLLGRMSTNG